MGVKKSVGRKMCIVNYTGTFYKTKKQLPTSKIKLSIENYFKTLKYHRTFDVDMSIAPCLQCIKIEGTQECIFYSKFIEA